MNKSSQLICAHSAVFFAIAMGTGWFFIPNGWFPPISPNMSADAVQAMYQNNRMSIRLGMTVAAFSSVFWWSLSAAIAMQMRRIEGKDFPILSWVQMASASGTVMIIMFASYFNLAAAFRPDMTADNIQLFNDLAWLMQIGAFPPAVIQNLAIAFCILLHSKQTVYPRWLGFANLWITLLVLPGALLPFFPGGGPFSWNGIIGFWVVACVFFPWIFLMWWFTVKAIKTLPDDE
jgi:hypothetical protein